MIVLETIKLKVNRASCGVNDNGNDNDNYKYNTSSSERCGINTTAFTTTVTTV